MSAELLSLSDIRVRFNLGTARRWFTALDAVNLHVEQGESVGLVGESGSSKSTLARVAVGLLQPEAGTVRFEGKEIWRLSRDQARPFRRRLQMVFQDPYASLNPRMRVSDILEEPLRIHSVGTRAQQRDKAREWIERVGLEAGALQRFPHAFSGGQRQRIGIARALILEPALVVADEPVSALDVSVQAQILNLMEDLRELVRASYLFISHDLRVVFRMCTRVAVMYLGRIIEVGPRDILSKHPAHPYTRALLSSIPTFSAPFPDTPTQTSSDAPALERPSVGCAFQPRCPLAFDRCKRETPELIELGAGHHAACFLASPKPSEGPS